MKFGEKLERNSAIEALRIIAMFFIVMSHASSHGGFEISNMPLHVNKLYLQVSILGNLGVDIFVIITGYLLCEKHNGLRRIVRILTHTWFYSVLTFIIAFIWTKQITIKMLISTLFPIITGKYWFITVYICLLLISPMLNTVIKFMKREEHLKLIIIMLVIWSIVPTFTAYKMYGNQVSEFMMFYLIGGYFKKYPDNFLKKKEVLYLMIITSTILFIASILMLDLLSIYIPELGKYVTYFNKRSSILMISMAIGLFSVAINTKPFVNSTINYIGECTLGIYLLHDSPDIREFLWQDLICNNNYANSFILIPRMIMSIFFIFMVGILIEFLRRKFIEKKFLYFVNLKLDAIDAFVKKRIY